MSHRAAASVDDYLAQLEHPRMDEILELRAAILASNPLIREKIKWNAPSFTYHGHDRVTFRLHPGNRVELVFHLGAKTASGSQPVEVDDPAGLLRWLTSDRAVVAITDHADLREKQPRLVQLVSAWMTSTTRADP